MIAKRDISELLILVLSAANMVVLAAEFLAFMVLLAALVLVWHDTAQSTDMARCIGGIMLSGAHLYCLVRLTAAKLPASVKIGGLSLLPLVSLALAALLLLGPA